MELSGEEKKLQALFSGLKAADEQATPHFGATWNGAQIAPRKLRVFNPAFVAGMMLLLFGVVAFAVWSRYSRVTPSSPQPVIATAPQNPSTITGVEKPASLSTETSLPKPKPGVIGARRNKVSSPHNAMIAANRKLEKDAKLIANWTSPTSALLESPSDEIFSSLPQLNQSATQLKSFLPSRSN